MNVHRQKQSSDAVKALHAAVEALERALDYQTAREDSADRWVKVRALQAQAQLEILHTISGDLDAICDAIHENAGS